MLYATFSKLDVAQVLEELKDEETVEKYIKNINGILKYLETLRFAPSNRSK
jgi:hypothetical protein